MNVSRLKNIARSFGMCFLGTINFEQTYDGGFLKDWLPIFMGFSLEKPIHFGGYRWDSRLELLTRYSAQLKGPRHADFMGQVGHRAWVEQAWKKPWKWVMGGGKTMKNHGKTWKN